MLILRELLVLESYHCTSDRILLSFPMPCQEQMAAGKFGILGLSGIWAPRSSESGVYHDGAGLHSEAG